MACKNCGKKQIKVETGQYIFRCLTCKTQFLIKSTQGIVRRDKKYYFAGASIPITHCGDGSELVRMINKAK